MIDYTCRHFPQWDTEQVLKENLHLYQMQWSCCLNTHVPTKLFNLWRYSTKRTLKDADKHLEVEEDSRPWAVCLHRAAALSIMKPKDYVQPKFLSTSVCLSVKDKLTMTSNVITHSDSLKKKNARKYFNMCKILLALYFDNPGFSSNNALKREHHWISHSDFALGQFGLYQLTFIHGSYWYVKPINLLPNEHGTYFSVMQCAHFWS